MNDNEITLEILKELIRASVVRPESNDFKAIDLTKMAKSMAQEILRRDLGSQYTK